jgi:mannose-6-phosphate isomerase
VELLTNPVRDYAWGSTTAIPKLLGNLPDGRPQAELWLGAHPDAPSRLGSARRPLDSVVDEAAEVVLGPTVLARFGRRLPFLLKVLAAAEPLSLQVHPSAEQALEGFWQEERDGVPPTAPHRRYRDRHHKPELVIALTTFEALCGLREPAATVAMLRGLDVAHLTWERLLSSLRLGGAEGLRAAFALLLEGGGHSPDLVEDVARACWARLGTGSGYELEDKTVVELSQAYPGDPGVVLSLLLNRVTLQPGQALYLPAGNVHAYLRGTAVEIMAASDNVLRAGLTSKHVDTAELVRTVDFTAVPVPWTEPECDGGIATYRPGAAEFELHRVHLSGGEAALAGLGPRIVLGLEGRLQVRVGGGSLDLDPGCSVFVPHEDGAMAFTGTGLAVVGAVPGA